MSDQNNPKISEITQKLDEYFSGVGSDGVGDCGDAKAPPRAQISRDGEIVALRALGGDGELCAGCCSDGSFFIYDTKSGAIVHRTAPGHTESVFAVVPHPSFPEIAATVSADATVRVWRETAGEMRLDAWTGGISSVPSSGVGRMNFPAEAGTTVRKSENSSGSATGTLGALFAGCWDPRPRSSLMLCGAFGGGVALVDVWRGTVRRLTGHAGCVLDVAWTGVPACLGCSVSLDGVGRLHAFDRPISLTASDSASFDISANSVEFVRLGVRISGCAFYAYAPLLALACGDGYVRVYDVRLFGESREAVTEYYATHGVTGTGAGVVEPI